MNSSSTLTMAQITSLGSYEIENHEYLKDLGSDSWILRHKKSGARIALLPNTDNNKVFYIAFRTRPEDSTGVAHIIEHTVLCGSRHFPVKDPFIEAAKGSLNTFLNAMTYPDKTVYPVASTNEKDFDNLMHIYLDAVFYPNLYSNENIFRQEGWHYETAEDGSLTINGVVYNEMKGVMSSPEDVLSGKVMASLFPHTTYAFESGGDPKIIPTLTYEQYVNFHRKFYHPSNSWIYLYGNMNMTGRLQFLDEQYLSHFEKQDVDSDVQPEQAFAAPVHQEFAYSLMEGENTEHKAFLSWNRVIPDKKDPKRNQAFKILDYLLCDAEGAPVKEALRKKGIGQEVSSLYEYGVLQPFYQITARYADADQQQEFEQTIHDTLCSLVRNGLDRKALEAGISYYEFRYRESDWGSYPKGLIIGLDLLDTWLYGLHDPWMNQKIGGLFDQLRTDAKEGYFEDLLKKMLLDNPHGSTVTLWPQPGLLAHEESVQRQKLEEFSASLTAEQKEKIRQEEENLRIWQQTPDSPKALQTIPVLKREDLDKKGIPFVNELRCIQRKSTVGSSPEEYSIVSGDIRNMALENGILHVPGTAPRIHQKDKNKLYILTHPLFTGGIDYVNLVFDITQIPKRLLPYLGMYRTLLCALDTKKRSYADLDNEINICSGGITPSVSTYVDTKKPDSYMLSFEIAIKAISGRLEQALQLTGEILTQTRFDDYDRMHEVLEEELAAMKAELPSNGHTTAAGRAASYLKKTSLLMEQVNGIDYLHTLTHLCGHFDEEKENLRSAMEELSSFIVRRSILLPDLTADAESIGKALPLLGKFADGLFDEYSQKDEDVPADPHPQKYNEGFTTSGQVQFVCRAGNYLKKGLPYRGSLQVLRVIMGYDYLWNRIRVKGGAYGCMSLFSRDGIGFMVTYRDPHLLQSVRVFEQAADYLRTFSADDVTMTKYVIGTISSLDRPLGPRMLGSLSMAAWLCGRTDEDMQKIREEILACTQDDIRALAPYLDAMMEDQCICVIGSEQKIAEHKELFLQIKPLIQ